MFARYTLNDVRQNRFYQLPKFLFEGEMKTALSNDAKVLYSLLRDRHDLSLSNRWVNDNGEVYILFSREDMANALGCSPPTLRKIITQLIDNKLMEEERQGLNKPNLIYLNYIDISSTDFYKDEKKQEKIQKDSHKTQETSGVKEIYTPDCKNLSVKSVKNLPRMILSIIILSIMKLSLMILKFLHIHHINLILQTILIRKIR